MCVFVVGLCFIVVDEVVLVFDVLIWVQILNLFVTLQDEFDFIYLFILYDFGVVHYLSW